MPAKAVPHGWSQFWLLSQASSPCWSLWPALNSPCHSSRNLFFYTVQLTYFHRACTKLFALYRVCMLHHCASIGGQFIEWLVAILCLYVIYAHLLSHTLLISLSLCHPSTVAAPLCIVLSLTRSLTNAHGSPYLLTFVVSHRESLLRSILRST